MVLSFESVNVTTEMKATEQYFPVVLFIMLYKVVLTFESLDGILNKTFRMYKLLSFSFLQHNFFWRYKLFA